MNFDKHRSEEHLDAVMRCTISVMELPALFHSVILSVFFSLTYRYTGVSYQSDIALTKTKV